MKIYTSLVLSVLSLGFSLFFFITNSSKKIAYVRSSELVYGYLGMQEANRDFEQKTKTYKATIDTLKKEYQFAFSKYSAELPALSKEEKNIREQTLTRQQESINAYVQSINTKAKEEENKSTEGVLNQINSFVEEYGKEKGYDVIFGTTLSGNLLYGNETLDITKKVLDMLNRKYKDSYIK